MQKCDLVFSQGAKQEHPNHIGSSLSCHTQNIIPSCSNVQASTMEILGRTHDSCVPTVQIVS